MLSASDAANRCGSLRHPGDAAAPRRPARGRPGPTPSARTRPGRASTKPSSSASSVLLPAPLGPTQRRPLPGGDVQRQSSSAARPSRVAHGDAVAARAPCRVIGGRSGSSPDPALVRTGRRARRTPAARRRRPSMLAWNRAPSRAQRQVRLRRQQQHEQGRLEVSLAGQQPQPDLDRDQRHRQRRQHSSTNADRNATRSVAIVAPRCASVISPHRRDRRRRGGTARSVGSPCTTSRKCPPRRASIRHWRCVRARVCMPTSAMNSGISGSVTATTTAETQSASSDHRRARRPARARRARAAAGSGRCSRRARPARGWRA